MKSFWQLPSRYILKNKEKSVAIIVSIVVSIALITSVFIIKVYLSEMRSEMAVNMNGGNYDMEFTVQDSATIKKIENDYIISSISHIYPYGNTVLKNENSVLEIKGYEENIVDYKNFINFEGKFPTKDNEIAIERWAMDLLPKKCDIGDTISLPSALTANFNGETWSVDHEAEAFKIVGLFDYVNEMGAFQTTAHAIITPEFALQHKPLPKNYWYEGYVRLESQYSIEDGNRLLTNTSEYKDVFWSTNFYKSMLPRMNASDNKICNFMFFIIIIVTSVVIFNTYNVIVAERKKDFGILRATGASPRQIKLLVILEGFILGIIFIPVGILLGGVITKFFLLKITGATEITGLLNIPSGAIISSFVIGFLFIFLGAYFPARKASLVSPMVAITSVEAEEYSKKKKQIKLEDINRLSKKLDINYNMARINIFRTKKRFITSVISLTISIILFLTINYIIRATDSINIVKENKIADITISNVGLQGISDNAYKNILEIEGLKIVEKKQSTIAILDARNGQLNSDGVDYAYEYMGRPESTIGMAFYERSSFQIWTQVYGFSEEKVKAMAPYLEAGAIDIDKLNAGEEILFIDKANSMDYFNVILGNKLTFGVNRLNKQGEYLGNSYNTKSIAGILNEKAIQNDISFSDFSAIITTEEGYKKLLENHGYNDIYANVPKGEAMAEYKKLIKEKAEGYAGVTVTTFEEDLQAAKVQSFTIRGTLYTFLGLIAFVSIVNLFQVMKMNVLLRRNEIGMLRAIGQSNSDVRKMILKEGYIYAVVSYVIGAIVGTVITLILYSRRTLFGINTTWGFPWLDLLIVLIALGSITFLASILAIRKILKESIIESIRSVE